MPDDARGVTRSSPTGVRSPSASPSAPGPEGGTTAAVPLALHLHRERGGPVIAREPVTARDLVDAVAELWFEAFLRRGRPAVALADVRATVHLVVTRDDEIGPHARGFELRTAPVADAGSSGEETVALYFGRESLAHVAARRARELVSDGRLEKGELYYYGLAPGEGAQRLIHGPQGRAATPLAPVPLQPLLDRAEAVDGAPGQPDYPLFFTRRARARAERVSRQGAEATPAVETGGLLLGPLCWCPSSGEVFGVVVDVLEATDSVASCYSLTYSGPTWARIQTILRARRSQPATRFDRVLGQAHGHNFLPLAGAEPCAVCHQLPVCTRSSAILSPDDRTWCRAVFSAEPWQLSQVHGLDARGARTERFYGQRGGSLVRRGYYVIDEFDRAPLSTSEPRRGGRT